MRFIGVEMDGISGRIARALHPQADIRIEDFRDSRLPEIDAVIGNVPFANLISWNTRATSSPCTITFSPSRLTHCKPGGVLALVTSHFTLDKQNAAIREYLAEQGGFLRRDPPALGCLQTRGHAGRDGYRVPAQAVAR